jgi:hypothetical protein
VSETKIGEYLSPDRLKLLWLLLKKRGIDFAPQQIYNCDSAVDSTTKESDDKSMETSGEGLTPG